ncbi:MAG: MurR/RpiR family transcriptional regulator [Pseudomonadota bacterium]
MKEPDLAAPETPETYEELRAAISARHSALSNRLQQVAQFALANPNDMALETVATVADRAGTQPSTLIRFAKSFGFSGFSDMQRIFQTRLVADLPSYEQRIRALKLDKKRIRNPAAILDHFTETGIHALRHLRTETSHDDLEQAVSLLADSRIIHIMALRRAFPVASYMYYGFSLLERHAHLIDGVGGMAPQQAGIMEEGDVLVAASFRPYSPETIDIARQAIDQGVKVIAITDEPLSPLVRFANVALEVKDAQLESIRSLSATMCLAITLVVGLGGRLETQASQRKPVRRSA